MPIMYISVPNIDEGLKVVARLGGRIIVGKTDAGDGTSDFATVCDLNGNVIGLRAKR